VCSSDLKLLSFVKKYPRRCNLREPNGKRSILIKDVPTVDAACRILEEILQSGII
jgi:transcription-repair coupling factor (superfamily II helicase)